MLLELTLVASIQLGSGEGLRVREWGEYGYGNVGGGETTWILHVTSEADWREEEPGFWILEQQRTSLMSVFAPDQDKWSWADSRQCPQMMAVLKTLSKLEQPRIVPPGTVLRKKPYDIADGSDHYVWFKGVYQSSNGWAFGRIVGDYRSPVARWVASADHALETCWSSTPPVGIPQNGRR